MQQIVRREQGVVVTHDVAGHIWAAVHGHGVHESTNEIVWGEHGATERRPTPERQGGVGIKHAGGHVEEDLIDECLGRL